MRTIVCRFQDAEELHRHLLHPKLGRGPNGLSFLGRFPIEPEERVKLLLVVEEQDERCALEASVQPLPTRRGAEMMGYVGKIEGADRIWLEMFLSKIETMRAFRSMLDGAVAA